jgi:hypothetical protein
MNEHRQTVTTNRSWLSQRTTRVVDKKGLAVALLFLVAMAIWAVERTEKASQLHITWQKLPALSDHLEIRPAVRMSFDTETARHFIQSSHFSTDQQFDGQS